MNHIHKLTNELAATRRELQGLRDGLAHLKAYLASDKFSTPRGTDQLTGYVNVNDIFLRLAEAEGMASDAINETPVETTPRVEFDSTPVNPSWSIFAPSWPA